MKRVSVLFCIALFVLSAWVYGQKTVTISITDANNPAGTKHYWYHKLSGGTYGSADKKDAGAATSLAWILPAPVALGTHYWVCTAYAADGAGVIESAQSNEVNWLNAPAPPSISITSIAAIPTFKGVILNAKTTVPARTTITYGMGNQLNLNQVVDVSLLTDHAIALTKLRPHTPYSYRWIAVDANGVTVTSEVFTFTTL